MTMGNTIRLRAAALLAGLALTLSGCFMSPGKFTSDLAITGPDSFTFRYDGEIFFLGLSELAQMGAAGEETFMPGECYDEDYAQRDCTSQELAAQRAEWDEGAEARAAEARQQARQMAAMMGGIDPSDPKAAEELVTLLKRQRGWNKVVHKGDGLFDVSYAVSGTLSHDFLFPTIEGFTPTNPFVQIVLRNGGQVRINAPAFGPQSADNPLFGNNALPAMAAMSTGSGENGKDTLPGVPTVEGTFTIRTAQGMRILANNTDDGPTRAATGEVLTWRVSPRIRQAPTALVDPVG